MAKNITKKKAAKFPLGFHEGSGQWRKKVNSKVYYFGRDKAEALARWVAEEADIRAGRERKAPKSDSITLKTLCDSFLTNAEAKRDSGEMTRRTFSDYLASAQKLCDELGKSTRADELVPDDLMKVRRRLAKTLNSTSLGNEVGRMRVILRSGYENGLLDKQIRFGEFKRPAKRVLRRAKANGDSKLFEPAELHTLIDAADIQMRAMILLGVNAAFGNSDCGQLKVTALDLVGGWVSYARPKTGVNRRCKLWPETVDALKAAIAARKSQDDELVFRTKYGQSWHSDSKASPLSAEFRKLCKAAGVYQQERGFYRLRHQFRTIADASRDFPAIDLVMGHTDESMAARYREHIGDDRLEAVADHVRGWLFSGEIVKS